MSYPEAIQYLESFINYEKILSYPYKESLKLERVKDFLVTIRNPQDSLRSLHVAGSKGKGSTCAFMAYVLKQAGYRVGLYTSPHLSDFRERIRILEPKGSGDFEGMISKKKLAGIVTKLKPAIERFHKKSKYGPLSFFEVYTTMAFTAFKEAKVDFAVLETGLGGRFDATNVVIPLVCALTPISYEHTQKLGNTLTEIAREKAGIIKGDRATVISAPQEAEAREVIRSRCFETGAKLYEVGRDILYEGRYDCFNIRGLFQEYPRLSVKLIGRHQMVNAAVAVGAIEALRYHHILIDEDPIKKGLTKTVWPGRLEILSRNPLVVLDGAQNAASAGVIRQAIKENFKYKRLILALGISNDKDIKGLCEGLKQIADEVVVTRADNPRATSPEVLARYFEGKPVHKTSSVKEAKRVSKNIARKEDLILVTGSLFVVGEFRDEDN